MDVVCFGFQSFGQLNSSNKLDTLLPQLDLARDDAAIKFVTFSWSKCYIILDDGTVLVQGFVDSQINKRKQVIPPLQNKAKKITCLRRYDLFLMEDGSCWKYSGNENWTKLTDYLTLVSGDGRNTNVKIVDFDSSDELHAAVSVDGLIFSFPVQIEMPVPNKVTKVSCGLEHYICLIDSGSVFVWGSGSRGQLGNGSLNSAEHPELLVSLDGLVVIDVDAGGWHSVAVTNCGDLYAWGWNNFGQLGFFCDNGVIDGDEHRPYVSVLPEPKIVDWSDHREVIVKQISCGTKHTIVLLDDGLVWGCGCNKYGQVSPISKEKCFDQMINVPVPEQVDKIHRVCCVSWYTILYVTCRHK